MYPKLVSPSLNLVLCDETFSTFFSSNLRHYLFKVVLTAKVIERLGTIGFRILYLGAHSIAKIFDYLLRITDSKTICLEFSPFFASVEENRQFESPSFDDSCKTGSKNLLYASAGVFSYAWSTIRTKKMPFTFSSKRSQQRYRILMPLGR